MKSEKNRVVVLLENEKEIGRYDEFILLGERENKKSLHNVTNCKRSFHLHALDSLLKSIIEITEGNVGVFTYIISNASANAIDFYCQENDKDVKEITLAALKSLAEKSNDGGELQ